MGLLQNKVVLVTGGTSGIGRTSAVLFAKEGAKVAITGRRETEGKEVVAEIEAARGQAIFIQADLMVIESIPSVVANVVAKFGRLDCAFNNAGVAGGGRIETLDEPTWDRIINSNLKAAFFCMKAEVEQMKRQGGGGAILFNASVLANIGAVGTSVYSASKGGIVSMARAAAVELGPIGIRVNCLNPSITRTPMTSARIVTKEDGSETHPLAANIPLGRLAEADEMAQAALFLLSDLSSYVNGHALIVDGGQSAY
jgi:NAD(P)-dependent dehydrogenase (short-subunit alcohol dehydrogenase family)